MLGGVLALLSAATFGANNAVMRRGVLTGTVGQALAISMPIGLLMFFLPVLALGTMGEIGEISGEAFALLAAAGVIHLIFGRYCNFRATKAMGGNLVAPVQQLGLILTLVVAIGVLNERVTVLKLLGIFLVIAGPMIALGSRSGGKPDAPKAGTAQFVPNYAEGYLFAALAAIGLGISPILIRLAVEETGGIHAGLAGGLISYAVACVVICPALIWPGQIRHLRSIGRTSLVLFILSGVLVSLSQLFRYMALAVAPVSVVTPIQRTAIVFRLGFARLINRDHEVFSSQVMLATAVSLLGALLLSTDTEFLRPMWIDVGVPAWVLDWDWRPVASAADR